MTAALVFATLDVAFLGYCAWFVVWLLQGVGR